MITAVRLVDGAREMAVYPREGIAPQSLDVAFPEVREVSEPRTDDDGMRDTTALFGARAVSLELTAYEDPAVIADLLAEIKTYLHPRVRPYLHVSDDGWAEERRIRLRADQFSEPYAGYASSLRRQVQVQWKAPDGVWEAADLTSVTVTADMPGAVGIDFPVTFPLSWTPTQATGAQQVTNPGGVPTHFVARLYGPCTGPELSNDSTGETIKFTSALIIAAGDYVEIDTRERTAYLLSQADAGRLQYVDFAATSWWRLEPGDNLIRYHPASGVSAGSAAVIDYRPAWL